MGRSAQVPASLSDGLASAEGYSRSDYDRYSCTLSEYDPYSYTLKDRRASKIRSDRARLVREYVRTTKGAAHEAIERVGGYQPACKLGHCL